MNSNTQITDESWLISVPVIHNEVKLQCNQVVGSQQPSMTYYEEEAGRRGGGASPIIIRRAPQPRLDESVWKLKAPK